MNTKKTNTTKEELINYFNAKVLSDPNSYESRNCLCGNNQSKTLSQTDRYGFWHSVVICKNCGLIFSNPSLTKQTYSFFYTSDIYRKIYDSLDPTDMAKERFSNRKNDYIYFNLLPYLNEKKYSILELGCGGGWNLLPFKEHGHSVTGYDFSNILTNFGKTQGLDLRQGGIEEIEGSYDIIILNHVIEHFVNFNDDLEKILRHLNPKGLIYIGVPNLNHFSYQQFQNAHVFYFTSQTFIFYLAKIGLKLRQFGTAETIHMYGIFEKTRPFTPQQTPNLKHEYQRMMKKIILHSVKNYMVSVLDFLHLKNLLKKILYKN